MNYWSSDYLATSHPTNDISMWVKGPVASDVSRFTNLLWKYTCDNRLIPYNGVTVRLYNTGGSFPFYNCVNNVSTDLPPPDPNGAAIMVVGKLGYGIDVPGHSGQQSAPIDRPKLSGNTCNATQASDDNKDVNTQRDYEYRNPGETALRALLATAKQSIFISQQDLLSCLPKPFAATEAKFDERVFATLAQKIHAGIPIKIVLSNPGGDYSNGWDPKDVAQVLMQMLQKNEGLDQATARQSLCQDVGLTTIRNNSASATWKDGKRFYNHAKLVSVDDQAFYIGSGNLYPSALQELGMIVEDGTAGARLKSAYLDPLWANSRAGALIDPAANTCGDFPTGLTAPPPSSSKSKSFVLSANTTKTFDVRYPSTFRAKRSRRFCQATVWPGWRLVKILKRGSTRGRSVCRVKARNTAKRRSRTTTAKILITATTAP
jgi:phosphatidylserine/phosphatidylglycerophosphate/cardiolipin synthase-like enzyme